MESLRLDPNRTNAQKVYVKHVDGETYWGEVYLADGERLQDMMNSNRQYIPINKLMSNRGRSIEDHWVMTIVNKLNISIIEERDDVRITNGSNV